MTNSDPRFRSAIANVEKASTGEALRLALVKYEPVNLVQVDPITIDNTETQSNNPSKLDVIYDYTGALPTLANSHAANIKNLTDVTWFDPPIIHPGEKLVDFNPNYKYVDQDGNELNF